MQTKNFAPTDSAPRTIQLGRNRMRDEAFVPVAVVKSFDKRASALIPSPSLRKSTVAAPIAANVAGRFDIPQNRD
jgi:hypothetical protein